MAIVMLNDPLVEANDLLGQMIVQAEYRSPTTDLRSLVAEMEEE